MRPFFTIIGILILSACTVCGQNSSAVPSLTTEIPAALAVDSTSKNGETPPDTQDAPAPLLKKAHPVDWWFVFKLNSAAFPGCGGTAQRACIFGGTAQNYRFFGQQFVYASNEARSLQKGVGCIGD